MKKARLFLTVFAMLLISAAAFAQNRTIKGTVIAEEDGLPAIGVSVFVKGNTKVGTVTDLDGNFSFKAPKGSTIVISFIGYSNQEVVFEGQPLNITLKEDSELLEDVVVIGYGVAKKNDMTGSVTAIKPDAMNKGLVTSAQDALQGKE